MGEVSFGEALRRGLTEALGRCVDSERVPLTLAMGRVLRAPVATDRDLPPFDNAAMDGFAIRGASLGSAGRAVLRVVGEARPGSPPPPAPGPGEAVRIATGAPVPAGADQVVPFEQADELAPGRVHLAAAPEPGRHIRRRGEDVHAGAEVLRAGETVTAASLALAAACGATELVVARRPRVGVLSCGDEVVPVWRAPRPHQVRDANGPALTAALAAAGTYVVRLGHARDEPGEVSRALAAGRAAGCDVLLSTAGVSVGARDPLPEAAAELGLTEVFRGVAMKPGHPVTLWAGPRALLFALPGNPSAAQVCFHVLVLPALRALTGHAEPSGGWVRATLPQAVSERPGRVHFRRARIAAAPTGGLEVVELLSSGSGRLLPLARANALAHLEGSLAAGDVVPVLPITAWGGDAPFDGGAP
jgi:molybdopterin molybdotransferase